MKDIVFGVIGDDERKEQIFSHVPIISKHECYYSLVDAFNEKCFSLSVAEHAIRLLHVLANLCEMGFKTDTILHAIEKRCNTNLISYKPKPRNSMTPLVQGFYSPKINRDRTKTMYLSFSFQINVIFIHIRKILHGDATFHSLTKTLLTLHA